TKGPAHQRLNVGLLLVDSGPQARDRGEQLGNHLFEEGRIVGKVGCVWWWGGRDRAHGLVDARARPCIRKVESQIRRSDVPMSMQAQGAGSASAAGRREARRHRESSPVPSS